MKNPHMSPLYARAWAKATRDEQIEIIKRLKPKPPVCPAPPVETPAPREAQ